MTHFCLRHKGVFFSPKSAKFGDFQPKRKIRPQRISLLLPCRSLFQFPSGVLLSFPRHPLCKFIPREEHLVGGGVNRQPHFAMSLTSRVFGLFSTTANSDSTANTTNSSTSTPSNSATTSASRVYSDGGFRNEIIPGASRHVQGALEEEEPRPPYHHVRVPSLESLQLVRSDDKANPVIGNAGRWNGWLCW